MKRYLSDVRLGDLLVNAGVISIKQLGEAFRKVGNSNLYVGQMLVLCGFLKTQDLTAGLTAQSHIKDGLLDPRSARRALGIACKQSLTFEQALETLNIKVNTPLSSNKLGEILVEAGVIEREQCQAAIEKSVATGLPLGRVLVLNFALPEKLLVRALEMQLRLRDGLITRAEAIEILGNTNLEDDVDSTFAGEHAIRLGELLVRAGILTRSDVLNVLEVGLARDEKIGQLLIKFGFLSDSLLESALNLQQMIDNSFLHPHQAARCLYHVDSMSVPVSQALVELGFIKMTRRASVSGVGATTSENPDSTFGLADQKPSLPRAKSRAGRMLRSLRASEEESYIGPDLAGALQALIFAYTRLAEKHVLFKDNAEAEWHFERIIALKERLHGIMHPSLARELGKLGHLMCAQRRFAQAERFFARAVHILENSNPYDGKKLAEMLNDLGLVYFEQGFYDDAEPALSRALTLKEMYHEGQSTNIADTMRDYARLLIKTGRHSEAEKMCFQARSLLKRQNDLIKAAARESWSARAS